MNFSSKMSASKFVFLFSLIFSAVLQKTVAQDEAVVAKTEIPEVVNDVKKSVTDPVMDDLNGPLNSTCWNSTNCAECTSQGCEWVRCSTDRKQSCVSEIGKSCQAVNCSAPAMTCGNFSTCEECRSANINAKECYWTKCGDDIPACIDSPVEVCTIISSCDVPTTANPNTTTTTSTEPTTTYEPDNTTTTTVTPDPDNTTTTTVTPDPDNTTTSTTPIDTTTTTPAPDTTTTTSSTTTVGPAPVPIAGGFSAGSFFGGITLTLAMVALGVGGYKFYKTRYDVNYRTL